MEPHELDTENGDGEREARYRELIALSRVSAAISGLSDLDAILRVALDNVLNIMNGNTGGILLVDEQTQTLSYRVYQGLSSTYTEKVRLAQGEGKLGDGLSKAEGGGSVFGGGSGDIGLDAHDGGALAGVVGAGSAGDLEEPGDEAAGVAQGGDLAEGFEEGLLHHVLGILNGAGMGETHREYGAGVVAE